MVIAALFIISEYEKQSKCSSTGKRTSKVQQSQTMRHNKTIKRNEPLKHTKTWTNLKIILLSEKRQTKSRTFCMIPFIQKSRKCRLIQSDRKRVNGCLGMGESGRKEELQRGTGNFWGDDVFTILPVVMASQGHTYVKTYQVVHFQIWAVYCMLVIHQLSCK